MSDKIKRFITVHIPVYSCNFRCSYCYVGQHHDAYTHGISDFFISPTIFANFFNVERTGGYCYFNLCAAGETLLHPQLIELVSLLTRQGHYVDIITNGVLSNKFETIEKVLDDFQKAHLFMKFSFHYLELKKLNLLEKFVENINLCKRNKISYTIEITPHDELIRYIDEVKEFSVEQFGALPHITVARNENTRGIEILSNLQRDEYYKVWSVFDSDMFNFKFSTFNVKRKEFCYAGEWSLYVSLLTGDYYQCYGGDLLGNLKNADKPINFRAIGRCRQPHCWNGHAFLTLGDIPSFDCITYRQLRNRTTLTGENWLQKEISDFFDSKLNQANNEYSEIKKKRRVFISILMSFVSRVNSKILRFVRKRRYNHI